MSEQRTRVLRRLLCRVGIHRWHPTDEPHPYFCDRCCGRRGGLALYTFPPEGGRHLVQGMVFNGVVMTVCVFDAEGELVHRARSMCCNDCAWKAAENWLLANGTAAEREYVNTVRAKRDPRGCSVIPASEFNDG